MPNPGNRGASGGEVMGKLWEEGPRHLTRPRKNLVLFSAMEMKEEGSGVCGWARVLKRPKAPYGALGRWQPRE